MHDPLYPLHGTRIPYPWLPEYNTKTGTVCSKDSNETFHISHILDFRSPRPYYQRELCRPMCKCLHQSGHLQPLSILENNCSFDSRLTIGNFRENFIFANSAKIHICDVKHSRLWNDLPSSVNYRVISPFSEGLISKNFAISRKKALAKIFDLTVMSWHREFIKQSSCLKPQGLEFSYLLRSIS